MRRKNLGELALLASAHPDFHFANSLGPTNPAFNPIFEKWKQFGNELGLPLTYGLGEQSNASFPEMVGQSIITVSVAEGFGLGFLEPWTFGKSLCGRNLPDITSDFAELEFPSIIYMIGYPSRSIAFRPQVPSSKRFIMPLNNFIQVTKKNYRQMELM